MNKIKPIYMDHAAATPLDSEILEAMLPYLKDKFYNPSATYLAAKDVRSVVEEARARTAKVLGVRPAEIIFTAGASEANNLAIRGIMEKNPGKKIIVSAIEHDSVLEVAKKYEYQIIPVSKVGIVDPKELAKMIDDDVVLISVMHINNEIGSIQHLAALAKVIQEARQKRISKDNFTPIYLHSDAAQAPNLLNINPMTTGVDLLSLNGGKIYGPKQSGALFVRRGIDLEPIIYGGGQEFGLRSGTENVANIVGFSLALEKAVSMRPQEEKRLEDLHKFFTAEITKAIPESQLTLPANSNQSFNFVHLVIPGIDNERLMMELDEAGVLCAVGSACSASSDEPSHVLKAIGFTDEQAQSSLRFTMGRATTEKDIKIVVKILSSLVK